jgi:hypothetical protein
MVAVAAGPAGFFAAPAAGAVLVAPVLCPAAELFGVELAGGLLGLAGACVELCCALAATPNRVAVTAVARVEEKSFLIAFILPLGPRFFKSGFAPVSLALQ